MLTLKRRILNSSSGLWYGWTGRKRKRFPVNNFSPSVNNHLDLLRSILPLAGFSNLSWLFIVFNLLLLSHVSEECPNTCQCKWVSGKESVSCFRAGLTKIPDGLDPGTQVLSQKDFPELYFTFHFPLTEVQNKRNGRNLSGFQSEMLQERVRIDLMGLREYLSVSQNCKQRGRFA